MRPSRAFTLAELLVIVVIVAVLVGLLMPAFSETWVAARQMQCTTRLSTLGKALDLRACDERIGLVTLLDASAWAGQTFVYVDEQAEAMLCPEGGAFIGGVNLPSLAEFKTAKPAPATDVYYTPMAEDRWVVKLSGTQYEYARSQGLLGNDASADNLRSKFDCTYTPDANPDLYWLCLEDHGGDDDFKDVMVRVTNREDGSVELFFRAGQTGHQNYVVFKTSSVEALAIPKGSEGTILILQGDCVETSYALNLDVRPNEKARRILLLDYGRCRALSTDLWADPEFDADQDGVPDFARHRGRINVLYTDGAVDLKEPAEIDPILQGAVRKYWQP